MRRLTFFLALPVIGLVGFLTPFLSPSSSQAQAQHDTAREALAERATPRPVAAVYRREARPNAKQAGAERSDRRR